MPKLVNGISPKMKDFCHAYLECGNVAKAYLSAYDTTNETVASVEGSKLLRRDDIREYIAKLNAPTVNRIISEREKKRNILWKGIERCIAKEDESGAARYMDILNKMDSEYVNINRNIDDPGEKLSTLTTEQLKELLAKPTEE